MFPMQHYLADDSMFNWHWMRLVSSRPVVTF